MDNAMTLPESVYILAISRKLRAETYRAYTLEGI